MHHTAAGSWTGCPQQPQSISGGVFGSKRDQRLHIGQQVSLLLLDDHRPAEAFLQAPQAAVPFAAGQNDPSRPPSCQFSQGREGGLRERRTVDQSRRIAAIQPPGTPALTVTIRGEQPEIGPELLWRTAGFESCGHRHDVQHLAKALV